MGEKQEGREKNKIYLFVCLFVYFYSWVFFNCLISLFLAGGATRFLFWVLLGHWVFLSLCMCGCLFEVFFLSPLHCTFCRSCDPKKMLVSMFFILWVLQIFPTMPRKLCHFMLITVLICRFCDLGLLAFGLVLLDSKS